MYVMSLQVERARVRFLDQLVRERQLERQLEGVDDVGPVGEEVVYCCLTLSQTTNFKLPNSKSLQRTFLNLRKMAESSPKG